MTALVPKESNRKTRSERLKARNESKKSPVPRKTKTSLMTPTQDRQVLSSSFDDIYTDPKNPASYSSNVRNFMNQKRSISLHKKRIKNFKRRQIIVPGPFHTISADLIDYQMIASSNNNYKYILTVIDNFSRMVYARALKRKTAEEVAMKLDDIISSMQFIPRFFTSDKGLEFDVRNRFVRETLVDKYKMVIYYTTGSKKNSMVERLNRTLKDRLERAFTETGRKRWLDFLPDFVNNINNSINRTIGVRPVDVNLENARKIWKRIYPDADKIPKCDVIKVGDRVRTVIEKSIFSKGYHQNWSDEIFTIARIERSMGVCLYILKKNDGEELKRKYYIPELNFVSRIETV